MQLGLLSAAVPGWPAAGAVPERDPVKTARRAEDLGYDAFWLAQPAGVGASAAIVLAAVAARTSRLRLGATLPLAALDPIRVAEDWATLDGISDGRAELGVECVLASEPSDGGEGVEPLRERLELLLRVWKEEEVSWSGGFRARLEGVTVQPRPVQRPHPPVWLACGGPARGATLAAALGLPLLLAGDVPPESLLPLVTRHRERLAEAGHDAARARLGLVSDVRVLPPGSKARPPAGLGPAALCGSPAEVAERLGRLREALGLSLHLARFDPADPGAVELYAREVAPLLR